MKKLTKILSVIAIIAILVMSFALVACTKKTYVQQTDTAIAFTIDKDIMPDCTGKHLVDYLNALQEKGELTYEVQAMGTYNMLIKINDRTADATKGEYWFIYADDEENTTEAWGTYEFEGKTYNSTNFGIDDMPIKEGVTFVFMISTYA